MVRVDNEAHDHALLTVLAAAQNNQQNQTPRSPWKYYLADKAWETAGPRQRAISRAHGPARGFPQNMTNEIRGMTIASLPNRTFILLEYMDLWREIWTATRWVIGKTTTRSW